MQQLVSNRWFELADLVLALACGAVLYFYPQVGGWVIIIALLPWLIRLASGKFTFERTFFVFPLALFVITAAIGVWAAYDHQAAWEKFWIIISATVIFAALVSQPKANLGVVTGLVGMLGVIIAIIFILNHDSASRFLYLTGTNSTIFTHACQDKSHQIFAIKTAS